jgi:hypothetical protein
MIALTSALVPLLVKLYARRLAQNKYIQFKYRGLEIKCVSMHGAGRGKRLSEREGSPQIIVFERAGHAVDLRRARACFLRNVSSFRTRRGDLLDDVSRLRQSQTEVFR